MHRLIFFASLLLPSIISCAQPKPKRTLTKTVFSLKIIFENKVDLQSLHVDSIYTNPYGETFTIRNFRYYLSHFSVTNLQGKTLLLPTAYFLIDERKSESKTITLQIPLQAISAIQFVIGVDSIKNVSSVQTGALDPANGMFWTWNSGYIFAKLEGSSPSSTAPQNGFTYHIGGFRQGENALRQVALPLPKPLHLSATKTNNITVAANINTWFSGSTVIKISKQPFTMSPGKLAMQIANNYSIMFSIVPTD